MATRAQKKKNIGLSLKELAIKMAVMIITIGIGLWCGWADSYSSFYIAVLVQAISNMYDSSLMLSGYTKFITTFHLFSFFGALISFILSVVHFTNKGNIVDTHFFIVIVAVALCIPLVHYGIEIYWMLKECRF